MEVLFGKRLVAQAWAAVALLGPGKQGSAGPGVMVKEKEGQAASGWLSHWAEQGWKFRGSSVSSWPG